MAACKSSRWACIPRGGGAASRASCWRVWLPTRAIWVPPCARSKCARATRARGRSTRRSDSARSARGRATIPTARTRSSSKVRCRLPRATWPAWRSWWTQLPASRGSRGSQGRLRHANRREVAQIALCAWILSLVRCLHKAKPRIAISPLPNHRAKSMHKARSVPLREKNCARERSKRIRPARFRLSMRPVRSSSPSNRPATRRLRPSWTARAFLWPTSWPRRSTSMRALAAWCRRSPAASTSRPSAACATNAWTRRLPAWACLA